MSGVNRQAVLSRLPEQTHIGPTVRRRRMNKLLNENPCIASPAAPANLVLLFETDEKMKHDRIRARCSFDSVTTDEDGFDLQVKIDYYVVEFQHAPTSDHANDDWADEPRRRIVDAVDPEWKDYTSSAGTDRITVSKRNHGFRNGDQVQFTGKPAQIGAPITAGNMYYVVGLNVSDGTFQLSFTKGGAAINLTGAGQGQVGFWVPHRYHVLFRGHLQKRKWYRFRVRAVAKGKSRQKSDWTDWEPLHGAQPIDNTAPPTPLLVTIHENAKDRVVIQWDDPPDADDSEIVDEDIAFYQVQLSKFSNFSTIYRFDRFQVMSHRSFKVKTVDKASTFYARVRSVDSSRNKSAWVNATLAGNSNPATPPDGSDEKQPTAGQAPNAPSNPTGVFDAGGTRHARYRVLATSGTSTTDSTHDDPHRYVLQLAHSATGPSASPPAGAKRVNQDVEGDATGDDLTVIFKNIPKNHYAWIRGRARNPGGPSAWSPAGGWVSLGLASASGLSSTVPNPSTPTLTTAVPRRLTWEWAEPDDEEVTRWSVTVKRAGSTVSGYPKNTRENRHTYRVPKNDVGVNHTIEVTAINALGNTSSAISSSNGSVVNDQVDGADIVPSSLPPEAFPSLFRPTGVVSSLPSLPNSQYPNGCLVFYTADQKIYRNAGGSWSKTVDGDNDIVCTDLAAINAVLGHVSAADIDTGVIRAGALYGGKFTTDDYGGGQAIWIAIDASTGKDKIVFHSAGADTVITATAGGVQLGATATGKVGFYGHTPVDRRVDSGDLGNTATQTGVDGTCRSKVNDIMQVLRSIGIIG